MRALIPFLLTACASPDERLQQRVRELERENQELRDAMSRRPSEPTPAEAVSLPEAPSGRVDGEAVIDRARLAMANLDPGTARRELATARARGIPADFVKRIERVEKELSVIGRRAPALDVSSWYQGYGSWYGARVTLVVFFEAWCSHCKKFVPPLQTEVYDAWRSRGVEIVALTRASRDTTEDQVREFIATHGLTFPVGHDESGDLSKAFEVNGVPAAALVRDQTILWRGHPTAITDDLLGRVLHR